MCEFLLYNFILEFLFILDMKGLDWFMVCYRYVYMSPSCTYLGRDVEWPEADGALGPLGYGAVAVAAAHDDDVAEAGTEMPCRICRSS